MTNLKFRIWYKSGKCFLPQDSYSIFCLNGSISRVCCHNPPMDLPPSSVDIQIFTGLKDHHGKEIYAGDILKHDIGLGPIYWKVVWCTNSGKWCTSKENGGHGGEWFDYYEVAGNIYENPELLKA